MPMPEQFKYDVRIRERLLRKRLVTEAELERHNEGLQDMAANAVDIELKQPALQTEAERAENSVIVRPAPPRPVQIAAPISLEDEIDDDEEEEEPRKPAKAASVAPAAAPAAAAPAAAAAAPAAAAAVAADEESDDEDEDDDDEDDEDDDDDDDDEDADDEESDGEESDGEDKEKDETGGGAGDVE